MKVLNQLINSEFFYLGVVESNTQVRCQVQFSCKISKHALEEGVNGLHTEIIIVVEKIAQGDACTFADKSFCLTSLLADHFHVLC